MKLPLFTPEKDPSNPDGLGVLRERNAKVRLGYEAVERAIRASFGEQETQPLEAEARDISHFEVPQAVADVDTKHILTANDAENLSAWAQKLAQSQVSRGDIDSQLLGKN